LGWVRSATSHQYRILESIFAVDEVYNNRFLHQTINACDKGKMAWILADIIIPVLGRVKVDYKAVGYSILVPVSRRRKKPAAGYDDFIRITIITCSPSGELSLPPFKDLM
jgi:hypothetical protein